MGVYSCRARGEQEPPSRIQNRETVSLLSSRLAALLLLALPLIGLAASPSEAAVPGQLYVFGDNQFGQLGTTTNFGTTQANPAPTLIALPGSTGPVVLASAGQEDTLAVTATGQLFAFGNNSIGQLGLTNLKPDVTPELVTLPGALGPVVDAAAGVTQSLAVTSTGQLYQLGGSETLVPRTEPVLITLPGSTGPVVKVVAGDGALAITSTGQLYEIGVSSEQAPMPPPTLVTLPGATGPVIDASKEREVTFAVTSTGQLFSWGYDEDDFGRQRPSAASEGIPSLVTLPGSTGGVTQVAAGGQRSLALTTTGQVYSFGSHPTLVKLVGASGPVTQIAAGAEDGLALTSTGQVFAFGGNTFGQLGSTAGFTFLEYPGPGELEGVNSTHGEREKARPPALVRFPGGTRIESLALGSSAYHTIAVPVPASIQPPATVPPRIEGLGLTRTSFHAALASTAVAATVKPLGTAFRIDLSSPAGVLIKISGVAQHGIVARGGSLTRAALPQGWSSVPFTGRIGRRVLAPGPYKASVIAVGSGGRSHPSILHFTVLPGRQQPEVYVCDGHNALHRPCYFTTPSENIRCVWTPHNDTVLCDDLATGRAYEMGATGPAKRVSVRPPRRGAVLPTNQILNLPGQYDCHDTAAAIGCGQATGEGTFELPTKGSAN
jgi:alpha-tubulin suppressor-like RCC1 family protein